MSVYWQEICKQLTGEETITLITAYQCKPYIKEVKHLSKRGEGVRKKLTIYQGFGLYN